MIRPSKKNTQVFLEKVRAILRENKATSQEHLIWQLNRVILGWANYHRHIVAMATFRKVDWIIWQSLWRWAKRRHNDKSSRWISRRYWHPLGGRSHWFAADTGERTTEGKTVWRKLVLASKTIIRRHLKIKAAANPFDPLWRAYLEDRAFFKKFGLHLTQAGIHRRVTSAPP